MCDWWEIKYTFIYQNLKAKIFVDTLDSVRTISTREAPLYLLYMQIKWLIVLT